MYGTRLLAITCVLYMLGSLEDAKGNILRIFEMNSHFARWNLLGMHQKVVWGIKLPLNKMIFS
jgi:hypothetical protein